jgi:hypothetical protein
MIEGLGDSLFNRWACAGLQTMAWICRVGQIYNLYKTPGALGVPYMIDKAKNMCPA